MQGGSFSRRSFCAGGMTLLSSLLLEQVAQTDMFILPGGRVENAYADSGDSSETQIVVVSRTEIGIAVYNMTDTKNPIAVPECTVELTSRFNSKTLSGKTDEKGLIVFDVTGLAEDPDADILGFNGSIHISCEGFREVFIPLTRIESHSAVTMPTIPLDGNPYFISLAMNEWDVQYSKQEFVTLASNSADVVIEGRLWLADTSKAPQACLVAVKDGTSYKIADFKVTGKEKTYVVLEAKAPLLMRGSNICLDSIDELKVDFLPNNSNSAFLTTLNVEAKPSPLESSSTGDDFIVPAEASSVLNFFKMPSTFPPPFGGGTINVWKPSLPIIFDFSIFGYALFGVSFSTVTVKNDKGKFFDRSSWETMPKVSASKQYEQAIDTAFSSMDAYAKDGSASDSPEDVKTVWHNFMPDYRIYFNVQAFCSLEYDWAKEHWTGAINAILSSKFDVNITRQFWIGSIPLYVVINPWASFQVSWRCGATTKKLFSFDWDRQQQALGFGFSIGLSITFGAGFVKLISASFTGAGYLTTYITFLSNPTDYPARVLAGFGHSGVVTLQLPLIKYDYPIWNVNEPTYFDSARVSSNVKCFEGEAPVLDKSQLDSFTKSRLGAMGMRDCVPVHTDGLPGWDELAQNSLIVTNSELKLANEFNTTKAAAYGTSGVNVLTAKSLLAANDGEEPLDDIVVVADANAKLDNSHLPSYSYVGKMHETPQGNFGVAGISDGQRGGIRPQTDSLMLEGVHSNTQFKTLVTNGWGRVVLFRIAAVDIGGGQMRRRLVYHTMSNGSWSEPWVVNFDPQIEGVSRDDLYDYEFDVTQALGNAGSNYIYIIVTHGTRPDGDDTSFDRTLQAHYVSLVALEDTGQAVNPLQSTPTMTAGLPSTTEGYTITGPSITGFSDKFSIAGTRDFCVMGFFTRCSVTKEDGIKDDGLTIGFFGRQEKDPTYSQDVFKVTRIRAYPSNWLRGTEFTMLPVKIEDDDYKWEYGSVAACRRTLFAVPGAEYSTIGRLEARYTDHDSSKFASFDRKELSTMRNSKLQVNHFYPWGDDELLATCLTQNQDGGVTSALYHVSFDPINASEPVYTQIGPKAGASSSFVVDNNGDYLFYIENVDGQTSQTFDDDGNVIPGKEEHRHFIMALVQVDGIFTRPFVFCELDHVIDDLASATTNTGYVSFMASSITDIDNSLSDVYDVRVPFVKCLTVQNFIAVEPFALCGEECEFSIQVRNDGNTVVKAATFAFYDAANTDEPVDTKHVVFKDDTQVSAQVTQGDGLYDTSGFTSKQLANPLVAADGVAVLTPGETRTIRVGFMIPEEWENKKDVLVKVDVVEIIKATGNNSFAGALQHSSSSETLEVSLSDSVAAEADSDTANGKVSAHPATKFGSYPTLAAVTLKAPSKLKAKAKKRKVTLSWAKQSSKVSGVEVKWAKKKSKLASAKTKKVKKANVRTVSIKKLKRKTAYYFKVRSYRTVGSKTYKSAWSKIVRAKTK